MQWCFYGQDLELPYLLDIGLSDQELRTYLKKYPDPVGEKIRVLGWDKQIYYSAPEIVRYSLAVRLARRGEYGEAANIFSDLGSAERAEHMKSLARLFARIKDSALSTTERLQALFDYADYIASNPDKLFFNDVLWFGMQTYAFQEKYDRGEWSSDPHYQPGFTRIEREAVLTCDRRLRDEQEERWKAFHIFEQVARDAKDTKLGRRAAEKIIACLYNIRVDRFGRKQEISDAISMWKRQLKNAKSS